MIGFQHAVRLAALTALTAAAVILEPASARAQGAAGGPDEVALKDGGFVRGTIVSAEPEHEIIILVMGSGQQRVIPWQNVERMQRGKYPASSGPPAPAASIRREPGAPPDGTPGYVRVHINTTGQDVELLHVTPISDGDGEIRESVCHAPCDMPVDGRGERIFRIGGSGVSMSPAFTFSERIGDVSLRVEPGNSGRWLAGLLTQSLGGAAAIGGVVLLASGKAREADPNAAEILGSGKGMTIGGGVLLGVGAAAIVGGIVLMATSHSHVSFTTPPETTISKSPLAHAARALFSGPVVSF